MASEAYVVSVYAQEHTCDIKGIELGLFRIFDSERNKEYLSESEYEVIDYYPDAPRARQQKPFLPSNLDIFVHSAHILDTNSIKTLIHKAKGRTVDDISQADLIISKHPLETTNKMTINENWILDCIERWRCKFYSYDTKWNEDH